MSNSKSICFPLIGISITFPAKYTDCSLGTNIKIFCTELNSEMFNFIFFMRRFLDPILFFYSPAISGVAHAFSRVLSLHLSLLFYWQLTVQKFQITSKVRERRHKHRLQINNDRFFSLSNTVRFPHLWLLLISPWCYNSCEYDMTRFKLTGSLKLQFNYGTKLCKKMRHGHEDETTLSRALKLRWPLIFNKKLISHLVVYHLKNKNWLAPKLDQICECACCHRLPVNWSYLKKQSTEKLWQADYHRFHPHIRQACPLQQSRHNLKKLDWYGLQ